MVLMVQDVIKSYKDAGFSVLEVRVEKDIATVTLKDHSKFEVSFPTTFMSVTQSWDCSHVFEERFLFSSSYLKCKYCGFEKN